MKRSRSFFVFGMLTVALAACDGDGGGGGGSGGQAGGGGQTGSGGGQGGSGQAGGGGQGGGESGCRDSSVCMNGEFCVGPDDINCGIPPQEECMIDSDCGAGAVCHSMFDGCSPDHVGSRCGPPCAQDADCGPGFVCPASGSCAPAPCDTAGNECLPSQICDTASIDPAALAPDRSNGCQRITCQSDGMCPAQTVCVNAYCQTGLGACSPPAP